MVGPSSQMFSLFFLSRGKNPSPFFHFLFSFSREDNKKRRQVWKKKVKKKKGPWQPTQSNPFPRTMKTHRIQASSSVLSFSFYIFNSCNLTTNLFVSSELTQLQSLIGLHSSVSSSKHSQFYLWGSPLVHPKWFLQNEKLSVLQGSPLTPFTPFWVTWFPSAGVGCVQWRSGC